MAKFTQLTSTLCLLASTATAYNKNMWKQMYEARRSSMVDYNAFPGQIENAKIVIDTRTAAEREQYDVASLSLPTDSQYIMVDYDNFYKADKYFASFKKDSEYYNSDNDGQDINIFALPAGFGVETPVVLPAAVSAMGADIMLLCGQRSCGCRWNLMWMHGFRGHVYYSANVNNYIQGLESASSEGGY